MPLRPFLSVPARLVALALCLAGCDLAQTPPGTDPPPGPPASVTGRWEVGAPDAPLDVPLDTAFTVDDDPTYASVELAGVFRARTVVTLTDTAGDVRGALYDNVYTMLELRYRRHDGVIVTDRGGSVTNSLDRGFEAVYVAPRLTLTSNSFTGTDFEGLRLDFSQDAPVLRRRLVYVARLNRLGQHRVEIVRPSTMTLRRTR